MKDVKKQLKGILSEDITGKNMRSIASNYSMFREWFYQPRTSNESKFDISKVTQGAMDEAFKKVQKKLKVFENRELYPYFLAMREDINSKKGKKKIKKEEDQEKTDTIIKNDSMVDEEDNHTEDKTKYAKSLGYDGKKAVKVQDGKVVSHGSVDWSTFCDNLKNKSTISEVEEAETKEDK